MDAIKVPLQIQSKGMSVITVRFGESVRPLRPDRTGNKSTHLNRFRLLRPAKSGTRNDKAFLVGFPILISDILSAAADKCRGIVSSVPLKAGPPRNDMME